GQIFPRDVLEIPRIACLNLHASLLPRWRGAAPIQAAIAAGDRETGITVMYMDEGLDTGDILLQRKIDILPAETGGSLPARLAKRKGAGYCRRQRRAFPGGSATGRETANERGGISARAPRLVILNEAKDLTQAAREH